MDHKLHRTVLTMVLDTNGRKKQTNAVQTVISRSSTPLPLRAGSPIRQSPFLQARKSPLLVASGPKSLVHTLKIRLLQMLAVGAATPEEVATKLKAPVDAISEILPEVACQSGELWTLQDNAYQKLKVWDWKGYTSAERSAVIVRASQAFDRQNLASDDIARIKLIHPERRNVEEKGNTSPLDLDSCLATHAPGSESDMALKELAITTVPRTAVSNNATEGSSTSTERKVTARGILTVGKTKSEKKKRQQQQQPQQLADETVSGSPAKTRPPDVAADVTTDQTAETRPATRTRDSSPQTTKWRTPSPEKRSKLITREDRASAPPTKTSAPAKTSHESKPQASMSADVSSDNPMGRVLQAKSTITRPTAAKSASLGTSVENSQRSQTTSADTAKLAPKSNSIDDRDEAVNCRTASITSTSSDRTDRTNSSALSKSTVASSVEPTPVVKVRSKFLTTTKKNPLQPISTPKPSASPRPQTDLKVIATEQTRPSAGGTAVENGLGGTADLRPLSKSELSPRKRKLESTVEEDSQQSGHRRAHTIDLHNMARDYKRLYPEYKSLHSEVASKIGDPMLLTKFMEMHNRMSQWKQTLHAAEKDGV